ncbi:MAG: pyridoxamine 5'-phosphate oxidase family protein [Thermoplasmatota archaeon]
MDRYKMRRRDKKIEEDEEIQDIIKRQNFFTISMCKNNRPYLVTMNYAYDFENNCFYFHCAKEGKKIDFLNQNPIIWGQIVEDRGYKEGECDHAYRSIHFQGNVEFIEESFEKRKALIMMIEQIDNNPEPVKEKFLSDGDCLDRVKIGRIEVQFMTGKRAD